MSEKVERPIHYSRIKLSCPDPFPPPPHHQSFNVIHHLISFHASPTFHISFQSTVVNIRRPIAVKRTLSYYAIVDSHIPLSTAPSSISANGFHHVFDQVVFFLRCLYSNSRTLLQVVLSNATLMSAK